MIIRAGCAIAFRVLRSLRAARRSLHGDNKEPRVGEQSAAVGLNRIGLLQTVAVAGEKFAALVVAEPLQERLQGRAGEPIGDAMRAVERMTVGRHPDADARSVRFW